MTSDSAPAAPSHVGRDALELLSSMRFAISLLTLICIASVIGTVVKQAEPANNYVNQFGPFWAEVFGAVNLYSVYSAPWFLMILAFLVVSTSLCIARNAPKILADLRSMKEQVREQALTSFHHKASGVRAAEAPDAALARVSALLVAAGWKAKAQVRPNGTMVAARKGAANKIGYLAAHSAIVLVCLGGLLDGDLVVRMQMALLGKSVYAGGGLISDVKPEHRLSERNPTFRGNLMVPEGQRAGTAILSMPQGVVLQDLPFDVELKKFIVEYYSTGMPKLFASEIVIHDHETRKAIPATVKVNEPAFHRGIAIYQSSFDDGGSAVKLRAQPLGAAGTPFDIEGVIGGKSELTSANDKLTLEYTGLRVINVENLVGGANAAADVRR
ncbi:MAG TPA: cytochrome c biogenesis protein ResB, partial [Burkholderiaceae bacterium]|nr:cytochrome c biogenesis protein ResB [Burkholderiaceae bacterium]